MYDYIQIATINDFIFCPRSVYFHGVYARFADRHYKAKPQIAGSIRHEASDTGRYSSRKRYLQGAEVFCERLGLVGKIDVYDRETQTLIERKSKIKRVYDGYRYQLYAQFEALREAGERPEKLVLHSLEDNKKYPVKYGGRELYAFEKLIARMRSFNITDSRATISGAKCARCIYRELCRPDICSISPAPRLRGGLGRG